jgi:hypothetical protein
MRKLTLCGILLALLISGLSLVNAQDEADPNVIVFPALVAGETVVGTFEDTATMQLYTFNGLEGDEVSIWMTQAEDSFIDPILILVGPRGEVVGYNDDSEDADDAALASAIIDAELPADGSYLVVATTLSDMRSVTELDEAAEYEITMEGASEVEIPEGESPVQLAGVTAEVGQDGALEVTFAEPVYYVFFSAEEGQTISISTGEAADAEVPLSDTMLWVFDNAGTRIAGVDDTDDGLYAAVEFEAEYSGAYLAFATHPFFYFAADAESEDEYFGAGTFNISISEG